MTEILAVLVFKLIGAVIGYVIPWIDALGYIFYVHPEDSETQHIRDDMRAKRFVSAFRNSATLLGHPLRLMHRSIYFVVAFFVLGIFVLTSTESAIGKGVVGGLGIHMILAMVPFWSSVHELRIRFFWGLADTVSEQSLRMLVGLVAVISLFALLL